MRNRLAEPQPTELRRGEILLKTTNILTSNDFFGPGELIRSNQEVQYDRSNQTPLFTGTWSLEDVANTDYDALVFAINFGAQLSTIGFGQTAGFHWGMTCGNDVIEGKAPVPKPVSLLLLGTSAALVPLRKRSRRRTDAAVQAA